MFPSIHYIGFWTKKQSMRQKIAQDVVLISFTIKGFTRRDIINGLTGERTSFTHFPLLSVLTYPLELDFATTNERENYAVFCRIPGLSYNSKGNHLQLTTPEETIYFPCTLELTPEKGQEMRKEFEICEERMKQGTPNSRYAANMLLMKILGELMVRGVRNEAPEEALKGARKFKEAIDNDLTFSLPLKKLAEKTGYTPGHARELFESYYKLTPNAYRAKKRLARIDELLLNTQMNCKEIADAVGMKHVTHLYAFLRANGHKPPASLRRKKSSFSS